MKALHHSAKALSRAEMKKVTGGSGFCVPDDGTQPCLMPGATISCSEIQCCCPAFCATEFSNGELVHVCRSWD